MSPSPPFILRAPPSPLCTQLPKPEEPPDSPSKLRLATAAGGDSPQKSLQAAPTAAQDVHLATRPALQGLLHTLPHSVTTFSVCPIPVGAAWQAAGQQPSSISGAGGDAVGVRLHASGVSGVSSQRSPCQCLSSLPRWQPLLLCVDLMACSHCAGRCPQGMLVCSLQPCQRPNKVMSETRGCNEPPRLCAGAGSCDQCRQRGAHHTTAWSTHAAQQQHLSIPRSGLLQLLLSHYNTIPAA